MNPWPCNAGIMCPGKPWCDTCRPRPSAWVLIALRRRLRQLAWAGGVSAFCTAVLAKSLMANDPPSMTDAEYEASLERTREYHRAVEAQGAQLEQRAMALQRETQALKTDWANNGASVKQGSAEAAAYAERVRRIQQEQEAILRATDHAERRDPWPAARCP